MDLVATFHDRDRQSALLKLFLLLCVFPAFAHAQGHPTSVLILHEGAGDSAGFNLFINGLRAELERESSSPVFVYEEALDRYEGNTDRSPGKDNPAHVAAHLNLLGTKYRTRKIDVIVPLGSDFLDFAEKYKETFAPHARVVYFAIGAVPSTSFPATGFVLRFDLAPTIDVALNQNPDARHVFLISGASPEDDAYRGFFNESVQRKAAELNGRVAFEYVGQDETFAELRQQLATAAANSISIFLTYDSDSAGQYFTSLQALRALAQSASRPMYSWASLGIGSGIVGGKLVDFDAVGAETATLINRVQEAPTPESIKPVQDALQAYTFDGRQMRRWGYRYDRLPKGSKVINPTYTFWELYRWRVIFALAVIFVQGMVLIFFIRDHIARRLAERDLAVLNELKASVLESIGTRVAVLDAEGRIIAANHYWEEYLEAHGALVEALPKEATYFEATKSLNEFGSLADAALEGIRAVSQGERDHFELEYSAGFAEERLWIQLIVSPLTHRQGGVVVTHRNVTQKKKDEADIRRLSGRLLSAQESERSRIGRELHDDINQQLALVAIEAQGLSMEEDLKPEFQKRAKALWEKVTAVSSNIETLSHQLHSSKLDYLGLQDVLEGLCREFSHKENIPVDFQLEGEELKVDHQVALALFRVAQESLRNIAKHSHADSASLRLTTDSTRTVLEIEDDGMGLGEDEKLHSGIGMFTMRERLELVNGTFDVWGKPEGGTVVRAVAPTRPLREHGADSFSSKIA
jgi:signal transduction histidine kinase